jgi:Fe-S-cluster containining protein
VSACEAGVADVAGDPATREDAADCSHCDAVCCRLTVVVQPEDRIPSHLTTIDERGIEQMARDEDGWCVAIDPARMCCSIYDERPAVCRRFVMDGPYCRGIRQIYASSTDRDISLRLE